MSYYKSAPASFPVDNWKRSQEFKINIREHRSYVLVLDFETDSEARRDDILMNFSDRVPGKGPGRNIPLNFEFEVSDTNGKTTFRKTLSTEGIGFFSKNSLGRLLDRFSLEKGEYVFKILLNSSNSEHLGQTKIRIDYMTM
ncbi:MULTISPECIES: DUF5625 family protein [unclassified Bosea (in: a-proteobacteria)]|uniref:DUF5625 family protein n=1 Tax=unclassified Bosea (in: a-proteobacteria) TaxID=2653178 RepID=UPI000F7E1173|nr:MULTISPECIES: DUF5625 family protein [unclassified Bosea (in: a-proteobacteria)]